MARELGFTQISCSAEVNPLLRLLPRAETTVVDAYLSPVLGAYLDGLAAELPGVRLLVMGSHGGLADAAHMRGVDAVLSGPAGGIVAMAQVATAAGLPEVIGFDMGGTSTDVSAWAGAYERRTDNEVAGVRLRTPMLAIHTIAAGGGSMLSILDGRYRVGPQSAGAIPGPVAYRRGGPLALTDANVLLGRIHPEHFPAVFGPDGDAPLDAVAVRDAFERLADAHPGPDGRRTPEAVAAGFRRVAVEQIADALRTISVRKGRDVSRSSLVCFGGAGGQHACAVAEALGISTVLVPPLSGLLCAVGIGAAELTSIAEQAVEEPLTAGVRRRPRRPGRAAVRAHRRLPAVPGRRRRGHRVPGAGTRALRRQRHRAEHSLGRRRRPAYGSRRRAPRDVLLRPRRRADRGVDPRRGRGALPIPRPAGRRARSRRRSRPSCVRWGSWCRCTSVRSGCRPPCGIARRWRSARRSTGPRCCSRTAPRPSWSRAGASGRTQTGIWC